MSATPQAVPDLLVLEEGLPFAEVQRRIALAFADAGLRHRALAFYLQEIEARGLHQLAGCRTTVQYATRFFGMSRREACDLLAAGRALRELRLIDAAFAEGRIGWSKVRELIRVVVPQHEAQWLERAIAMGTDELALEVRLRQPGEAPRKADDRKGLPEIRLRLNTALPPDVFAKWQLARNKVQAESGRAIKEWEYVEVLCDLALSTSPEGETPGRVQGFDSPYSVVVNADPGAATVDTEDGRVPIDDATAEMIACDAGCVDPSRCDQEADRRIPPGLRRRLYARDGGCCLACGTRHRKQGHHQIPVSRGGLTRLDNLLTLCRTCHALVHADLMAIVGDSKSGWSFLDTQGRDLHALGVSPAEAIAELAAAGTRLVRPPVGSPPADGEVNRCEFGTACQINTPVALSEMVGQTAVVESMAIAVKVARKRDQPLGHSLLCGPPGLGKTTLARAIAGDLGARLHTATGVLLQDPPGLVRLLAGLERHDVLLIDEIHAIATGVAEVLYEAMTDRRVSLVVDGAACARSAVLTLPPFTLIGATTDESKLPEAFLSRFEHVERLEFYGTAELAELICRAAAGEGIAIDDRAAGVLAEVARGTPREALRLMRRAHDEALAGGREVIDGGIVARTLTRLGIDSRGLGPTDRRYLGVLRERGPQRPLGLARLAAILGRPPQVLERLHEPYIFRLGLATTTPSGRVALGVGA